MENINIDPTANTPAIRFDMSGRLMIEGRSLPDNVMRFYDLLLDWVRELKAETTKLDINLEYANSASSKKLMEMLRILDASNGIKELIVNWHYESDDEDALECGQIYEELTRKAVFRYHEYEEAEC